MARDPEDAKAEAAKEQAVREEAGAKREIKVEQDKLAFGKPTAELEWDGIRKLDYPPPKWWVLTFWATFVWAAIWWVLYPSWPGTNTYFPGILGWDQRVRVAEQLTAAEQARAGLVDRIAGTELEQIRADPELLSYAVNGGRVLFGDNCAPCHGLGGAGQGFFPTLADDDWLWGGTLDAIQTTVTHGVRNGGAEARDSQMPRFGADQMLTRAQIADVAEYLLSLSNRSTDAEAAKRGETVYTESCVACHGEAGAGMPEMGAPRLNDAIWLYGGDKPSIMAQVINPRHGVMPAFGERLEPTQIKMLALYVHSLGGGQ